MSSFVSLPTEVKLHIFLDYLQLGDLIAISRVGQPFRSLALDFKELSRGFASYYGIHPFLQEVIDLQKAKKGVFETNRLIAICELARLSWNIEAKPLMIPNLSQKIEETIKAHFLKLRVNNLPKPYELSLSAEDHYLPSCIDSYREIQSLCLDKSQVTAIPRSLKALTQLKKLSIEDTIQKLPSDLTQLTYLSANNCPRLFSFSKNSIAAFDEICALTALKTLHLSMCQLSSLPYRIRRLSGIEEISLDHNRFTEFPIALLGLKKLRVLDLSHNKISALPLKVDKLLHLTKLFLSHNELAALPRTVGNLSELMTLMVMGNRLQHFPRSIIKLTQLRSLLASHNRLIELPQNFEKMSSLTDLLLNHNRLKSVPATLTQMTQLKELWLNNNALTELPEGLERLTQLKCLNVSGQRVKVPDAVRDQLKNTLIVGTRYEE